MKHLKTFEAWVEESQKKNKEMQDENIAFWAGAESPSEGDDEEENFKRMFRDKQISHSTNYGRKISYI